MEKNVDNIKLYLRWMMSEPIGDTMFKAEAKVPTDKDTQPLAKHDPHTPDHTAVSQPKGQDGGIEQESTEAEFMIT
jgi:hypothetical protein